MYVTERLVRTTRTSEQINEFSESFTRLKSALDGGLAIQTSIVSFRIAENVNRFINTQSLMKLNPADMDDPFRPECLPETRLGIIGEISNWVTDPTIKYNVFWLHGFPGAGKSTIATSVANMFRDMRRLGALMFFTRGVEARSDPAVLIRTIAYQLGEFDPRICEKISQVIADMPSIKQAPLRVQFQKLLVEPLASNEEFQSEGPVLIVIDALDECGRTGNTRQELLRVLAVESSHLPSTVRIFVTSRAEKDIQNAFSKESHIHRRELDIGCPVNAKDVRAYIHNRMVSIREQNVYLGLPDDWPGDSAVDSLTKRASGLFVWASTACRYVENGQDPKERLSELLQSKIHEDSESALDSIYITALDAAGKWDDPVFAADFREILGMVIVASNPLTAQTIDILNADFANSRRKRPCLHTVQHLGCVLHWAVDKPIRVMHPSFADFITERRRCGRDAWYIDKRYHHLRLAQQCMARLGNTLQKNIHKLTLSMSFEPKDLPEDIAYSCKYWIDHLCEVECSEASLGQAITAFLHQHFLHWVEAMSVIGRPRQTITSMDRLKDWVDVNFALDESLRSFVRDANRFCQAYAPVFEQHPLLVYQSALPFTPTSSIIYRTFNDDALPQVNGFRDQWSPLLSEFSLPGKEVTSLSCSPDGRYIVSATTQVVSVYDSTSYELLTKVPFAGQQAVKFVKFSPDSQKVASCHTDRSVRLWDALSGKETVPTMEQHTGAVYALAFSEDGTRLISGGQDQKIMVWDAETGELTCELAGHTKTILCLAFAPTGTRFVSGSRDSSIRRWDAATSQAILPPIIHHEGGVTALTYTPDGQLLISASDHKFIYVSDAETGTLLRFPGNPDLPFILSGHKSAIYSIAISPNGTLLASASKDTTVRLWDIHKGVEHTALVRQHRLQLRCVAFTADGQRIVTASSGDPVVRVWDVESTGSMGIPRRHKGLVGSLAFSSDGKYLVSGGKDQRVRVWNAETGETTMEFVLEQGVYQVGFSEDDSKIAATDDKGATFTWNAATREPLMTSPEDAPHKYDKSRGLLALVRNRWIVDARTEVVLSILPSMSPVKSSVSYGDRIAIGTANGGIVIMRIPLNKGV
ncbi:hypothetical protein ID866_5896 [Astraeus odoratus]|nr:hypothetical protein ID866_5896 [Astraeus odoratus]